MYLMTQTRPDISYALGVLARYMSNPSIHHFKAIKRLWGYIKRTRNYGLFYTSSTTLGIAPNLVGYCDSDWGGNLETRKSTTGYIYLLNNTPISWASKLQKTVALSSCEAEYIALTEAIKELSYLNTIFSSIPLLAPSFLNTIYTDS